MQDLFRLLYDEALGTSAEAGAVVFSGVAGLRSLDRLVRVQADNPRDCRLRVVREEYRSSALTLLQLRGSALTLNVLPSADHVVHLVLTSVGSGSRAYAPAMMRPAMLFDSQQHFEWNVPRDCVALVVTVPRSAIDDYVETTRSLMVRAPVCTVAPGIAEFSLALLETAGTVQADARTPVADYAIERFLQEMIGIVLVEHRGWAQVSAGPRRKLYYEATAIINELYRDPGLTAADVAHALNVSLRTLQLAFQHVGTNFSEELRAQRARAARNALLMPQYDVLSMAQIAEHAGYRNADTMRDELKRRFGLTPRRIREQR